MQIFTTDSSFTLFSGAEQFKQGEMDAIALVMTTINDGLKITRAGFDRVFTHAFGGGYYLSLDYDKERLNKSTVEKTYKQATEIVKPILINWNCCTDLKAPDWKAYKALELCGVTVTYDESSGQICEKASCPDEVDFFSIYGVLIDGGCECLHDFPEQIPSLDALRSIVSGLSKAVGLPLNDFS